MHVFKVFFIFIFLADSQRPPLTNIQKTNMMWRELARRRPALVPKTVVISTLQLIMLQTVVRGEGKEPQVPCFFIFGDSLSDCGNNNGLESLARADFLPYGIDFPGGPTGRFTNGRTTVDLIGDNLGLEDYIPSFSTASGTQILRGVNYASGSSGIRSETGDIVGGRIPMDEQLKNHQAIISQITAILGKGPATDHLNSCLYSVYAGSNDYMLNYFLPESSLPDTYTPEQFTDALVLQYTKQLKALYQSGARKVAVFGLGPLGCLPMLQPTDGACDDKINSALKLFNAKVKSLVIDFNGNLPHAQFIFVNTFSIVSPNLSALGLKTIDSPCCGQINGLFCLPMSVPCQDRSGYAYWDNAHPTEAANKVLASRAYSSQHTDDTYPTDIARLVSAGSSFGGPTEGSSHRNVSSSSSGSSSSSSSTSTGATIPAQGSIGSGGGGGHAITGPLGAANLVGSRFNINSFIVIIHALALSTVGCYLRI